MDRYLAACYPDEVCALDYLSPDTLIAVSDGMRVLERSKNYHWELSEDVKPLIEEGVLCGEFAALALSQEALSHRMGAFPALLLDSLPTSRNLLPPRAILSMNARSLPSYGAVSRPPRATWSAILAQAAACSFSAATKRARKTSGAFWKSGTSARSST